MNNIEFEKFTQEMIDNGELVNTLNKNFDMIANGLKQRDVYMFNNLQKMEDKMDSYQRRTESLLIAILTKVDPTADSKQILTDSEKPETGLSKLE
jgi:hypothetical protein